MVVVVRCSLKALSMADLEHLMFALPSLAVHLFGGNEKVNMVGIVSFFNLLHHTSWSSSFSFLLVVKLLGKMF